MIRNGTLFVGDLQLVPGCMYRIRQDVEPEHLRGRTVVYTGFIRRMWDNTRAIVTTLDPINQEEWWILPHCLTDETLETT